MKVPLAGLATDGFRDLIETGYTGMELLQWLQNLAINGVNGMSATVEIQKEENCLVEKGERSNPWGEVLGAGQKTEQVMGSVTGDDVDIKKHHLNGWAEDPTGPVKECERPIEVQQTNRGSREVQMEEIKTLPSSLRKVKVLARSPGVKGTFFANKDELNGPGKNGLILSYEEKKSGTWKGDGVGSNGVGNGWLGDDSFYSEDDILKRVNRRRGRKKVVHTVSKRKGAEGEIKHGRRGRPKGSRNKPKTEAISPLRSQADTGIVTASAWAERAWILSKKLGVEFDGDDGVIVKQLAVQVRQNHPNLL